MKMLGFENSTLGTQPFGSSKPWRSAIILDRYASCMHTTASCAVFGHRRIRMSRTAQLIPDKKQNCSWVTSHPPKLYCGEVWPWMSLFGCKIGKKIKRKSKLSCMTTYFTSTIQMSLWYLIASYTLHAIGDLDRCQSVKRHMHRLTTDWPPICQLNSVPAAFSSLVILSRLENLASAQEWWPCCHGYAKGTPMKWRLIYA